MKPLHFYRINMLGLLSGVFLIPTGLILQMRASARHAAAHPEVNCSFVGILYFFLMAGFVYILVFLTWNFLIGAKAKSHFWTWLQFVIIFIFGVIPALFLSFWGFVAS